jgi:hypothetical protein
MQIIGNAIARERGVEIGGAGKITSALFVQAAVARKSAGNLANTVGAKVDADAGILVANGGQRLAACVGTDERDDEFVGDTFVVGIFHALHRVGLLAAFGVGEDHGVVGF